MIVSHWLSPLLKNLANGQSNHAQDITKLKADFEALKSKQAEHDGLVVAVTRLEERVGQMSQQLANQGPVIAQVVAMTIKETFAALGVSRRPVSA